MRDMNIGEIVAGQEAYSVWLEVQMLLGHLARKPRGLLKLDGFLARNPGADDFAVREEGIRLIEAGAGESEGLAMALHVLGVHYAAADKLAKAFAAQTRSARILEKLLGPKHPRTQYVLEHANDVSPAACC